MMTIMRSREDVKSRVVTAEKVEAVRPSNDDIDVYGFGDSKFQNFQQDRKRAAELADQEETVKQLVGHKYR